MELLFLRISSTQQGDLIHRCGFKTDFVNQFSIKA